MKLQPPIPPVSLFAVSQNIFNDHTVLFDESSIGENFTATLAGVGCYTIRRVSGTTQTNGHKNAGPFTDYLGKWLRLFTIGIGEWSK